MHKGSSSAAFFQRVCVSICKPRPITRQTAGSGVCCSLVICTHTEDGSGDLSFEKFLNMMAVFSHRTDPEIKMTWAFAIWDFDGDDVIGPGELPRSGAATTIESQNTRLLVRLPLRDKESIHVITYQSLMPTAVYVSKWYMLQGRFMPEL